MIGIAALLAAMQVAAPAAPQVSSEADEIVVLGQRMTRIKARVVSNRSGRLQCRVRRSSGLPELDGAFCAVATRCAASQPPNRAAMAACVESGQNDMISAMAAGRARARQQGR